MTEYSSADMAKLFRTTADRLEAQPKHVQGTAYADGPNGEKYRCLGSALFEEATKLGMPHTGKYDSIFLGPLAMKAESILFDSPSESIPTYNDSHTKAECVALLRAKADQLAPPDTVPAPTPSGLPERPKRTEKPGTKRYTASMLRKAANILARKDVKLVKGSWGQMGPDGVPTECCAFGAIKAAYNMPDMPRTVVDWLGGYRHPIMSGLTDAAELAIKTLYPRLDEDHLGLMPFNDIQWVQKSDVVSVMRLAARILEHGGKLPPARGVSVAKRSKKAPTASEEYRGADAEAAQ
jgi:hypothetical protein